MYVSITTNSTHKDRHGMMDASTHVLVQMRSQVSINVPQSKYRCTCTDAHSEVYRVHSYIIFSK